MRRGIQNAVEDGADKQQPEGLEHPDQRHGQHGREDVEPERPEVSEESVQFAHSYRRLSRSLCIKGDNGVQESIRKG